MRVIMERYKIPACWNKILEIAAAGVTGLTDVTKDAWETWRRTGQREAYSAQARRVNKRPRDEPRSGTMQAIHDAIEDCDG